VNSSQIKLIKQAVKGLNGFTSLVTLSEDLILEAVNVDKLKVELETLTKESEAEQAYHETL